MTRESSFDSTDPASQGLSAARRFHLCYCTNIFPGESYQDLLTNLREHVADVLVCTREVYLPPTTDSAGQTEPLAAVPLGLRISNQASLEMEREGLAELQDFCKQHRCYIASINGFPFGTFHNDRVKAAVYDPDWRQRSRVSYTLRLIDLAARMHSEINREVLSAQKASLPAISISTSPIGYKEHFALAADSQDWQRALAHLREAADHCLLVNARHQCRVEIALEPEPACVIETLEEVRKLFAALALTSEQQAVLGICLDCCHQAVQFESPEDWLQLFKSENIRLSKVQISSAIRAEGKDGLKLLAFDEPVYLHQCVLRSGNSLFRINDIPQLQLFSERFLFEETRCHFHVPIFAEKIAAPDGSLLSTTQTFMENFLKALAKTELAPCCEVETYSFTALPDSVKLESISENMERELRYANRLLDWQNERSEGKLPA